MTCATCRHFRRGISAGFGYCALDRRREVLNGEETRPCWQGTGALDPAPGLFETVDASDRPVANLVQLSGRTSRRVTADPRSPAARVGRLVDAPTVTPALSGDTQRGGRPA
jgi:hypothetical protein